MGAIRANEYMNTTGLYMLQPYDPDRIPLIFVHGLISTPQDVAQCDQRNRNGSRCCASATNAGSSPIPRETRRSTRRFVSGRNCDKLQQVHPDARDYVLVGHSMGGIVSRTQVTNIDRDDWDVIGKDKAGQFFANVKEGDLIERCTIFHANPHVDRADLHLHAAPRQQDGHRHSRRTRDPPDFPAGRSRIHRHEYGRQLHLHRHRRSQPHAHQHRRPVPEQPHFQGARRPPHHRPAPLDHRRPRQGRHAEQLGRRGGILELPSRLRASPRKSSPARTARANCRKPSPKSNASSTSISNQTDRKTTT